MGRSYSLSRVNNWLETSIEPGVSQRSENESGTIAETQDRLLSLPPPRPDITTLDIVRTFLLDMLVSRYGRSGIMMRVHMDFNFNYDVEIRVLELNRKKQQIEPGEANQIMDAVFNILQQVDPNENPLEDVEFEEQTIRRNAIINLLVELAIDLGMKDEVVEKIVDIFGQNELTPISGFTIVDIVKAICKILYS